VFRNLLTYLLVLLFSINFATCSTKSIYIIPANLKSLHLLELLGTKVRILSNSYLHGCICSWNYIMSTPETTFCFSIHQSKLPTLNQLPRYIAMQ